MRRRLELSLVTGDPTDVYPLRALGAADAVFRRLADELHQAYHDAGAARLPMLTPSVRDLVTQAPPWLDRFVDWQSGCVTTLPLVGLFRRRLTLDASMESSAGPNGALWRSITYSLSSIGSCSGSH